MSLRTIDVNGVKYRWTVGRQFVLVRRPGKRRVISIAKVLGLSEYDWERLCWKSPSSPARAVTPGLIREFIEAWEKE